jgi:NodT family efflux transporter outer membrane factor (OMF) lipoprotein
VKRPARWLAAGSVALLGGCDLAPTYHPPAMDMPQAFKEEASVSPVIYKNAGPWQPAQPADTTARGPWWEAYGDPDLNRLEAQVDTGNQTLAETLSAYDQARDYVQEAKAGLLPSIGVGGTLSNNKQSTERPLRSAAQPNYYGADTIDAQATYEADIWGRVRDLVAAGKAQAQASAADLETVRLSLHVELADDYTALRGLDEQIGLLENTVTSYARALTLVRNRFIGNIASGVDVAQAETQLDAAKVQLSDIIGQRQLLEHAIATLIGQAASVFSLPAQTRPLAVPEVPAGLPSTLLQRRPDIAAAERQVAAANQLVGVAKAAFYPSVSLTALGGLQAGTANLFSLPFSFWSVGPSVSLPLFQGGLRRAELAAAVAAFNGAGARYRATVLGAFQDVEDNLAELHWLAQAIHDEDAAVAAARRSVDLALTLYRDGAENYLQVITAQTAELSAEQQALSLRTRRVQASLGLVRATGGGWTTADLPEGKSL